MFLYVVLNCRKLEADSAVLEKGLHAPVAWFIRGLSRVFAAAKRELICSSFLYNARRCDLINCRRLSLSVVKMSP
jgi:hypothetical protein